LASKDYIVLSILSLYFFYLCGEYKQLIYISIISIHQIINFCRATENALHGLLTVLTAGIVTAIAVQWSEVLAHCEHKRHGPWRMSGQNCISARCRVRDRRIVADLPWNSLTRASLMVTQRLQHWRNTTL